MKVVLMLLIHSCIILSNFYIYIFSGIHAYVCYYLLFSCRFVHS